MKLKCFFLGHNWTSNHEQGIPPTEEQINGGIVGFFDYARMYCKRCGKESKVSKEWRQDVRTRVEKKG